jgi:adenylate cyclase
VETVLEGSVRKAGEDIRVTAQLINADDESHLWASNYDRKLENLFALQDEVAKATAAALHVQMTPQNNSVLAMGAHHNLTAYDLVMQGKHQQYNAFNLDRAMALFEQALAIDSTYVPALVAKAGAFHARWVFGGFADMEALRRKRELAVKLDPKDPEALPMLAHA